MSIETLNSKIHAIRKNLSKMKKLREEYNEKMNKKKGIELDKEEFVQDISEDECETKVYDIGNGELVEENVQIEEVIE